MSETKHTPSESYSEQVSRLRQMTDLGAETWDLSDNDRAAISAVLNSHDELRDVAEALLLFYTTNWTDEKVDRWFALTGSAEATTKALCDFTRRALAKVEGRSCA